MFLYTDSDSDEAERLKDYLQGNLRNVAVLRSITEISSEELDFGWELRSSGCVVLIGSSQASSLIQNKQQEGEEDFITFDGKVIHDEFTKKQELVDKLIIVYFKERIKNDWIPSGLDERRIFHLQEDKIRRGNPALEHLAHWIKQILGVNTL